MKKFITLLFVAGALFLTGCTTCHRTSTAWEYRVVRGVTHQPDLEEKLNKAGADGFAIESIQTLPAEPNSYPVTVVILKKHKP